MSLENLLDKIAHLPDAPSGQPEVPPPEIVGFFIRYVRGLKQWKQSTLADFSNVSLSTIERVERGEKVGDEALDCIAEGLGYPRGYFTEPRLRCSTEEARQSLVDTYGCLESVPVSPMTTHRSVREAAECHAFLIHRPDVPECYDTDIQALIEWLHIGSFMLSSDFSGTPKPKVSRRILYDDIIDSVRQLERNGLTVLTGVMAAPREGIPDWKVAIISITSKLSDPGAVKRRHLLVDRRHVSDDDVPS